MSTTLVEKIQLFVSKTPFIHNGTRLSENEAENKIWQCLSDSRICISKNDPETHALLNSDLIGERDIRTVFCDDNKIALPCVRAFMKDVMATSTQEAVAVSAQSSGLEKVLEAITANKPIGQYKTKELLEQYNAEASQEIWDELAKRANGKPCIVFDGNKVDVKVSLNLIQDLRKGLVCGPIYNDGKKVSRVYPVGSFPEETVLCCPITGKILNNGYSQDLGVNWSKVPEEVLVFVRVIRDQNRNEAFTKFAVKALLRVAEAGMEALRSEYAEEWLVYEELKSLNQLPSIRVSLNAFVAGRKIGRISDPFGSPKRS